jgi:hypothetical protein
MLLLFAYGLWNAIPNRATVELENEGVRAFKAGEYRTAERTFVAVLQREPRSVHARFGLACAFFLTDQRSRAALELTMALEIGLPLDLIGDCGHHLSLDRRFLTAKVGLTDAFAAPRVTGAQRYEQMLTSEPSLSAGDEADRLLIGSCLSFRAKLDGAGWYYAANAAERSELGERSERLFLDCVGADALRRLDCDSGPALDCVLSDRIRQAYLVDRAHLRASEPSVAVPRGDE